MTVSHTRKSSALSCSILFGHSGICFSFRKTACADVQSEKVFERVSVGVIVKGSNVSVGKLWTKQPD